jgi:hypothetical protein
METANCDMDLAEETEKPDDENKHGGHEDKADNLIQGIPPTRRGDAGCGRQPDFPYEMRTVRKKLSEPSAPASWQVANFIDLLHDFFTI